MRGRAETAGAGSRTLGNLVRTFGKLGNALPSRQQGQALELWEIWCELSGNFVTLYPPRNLVLLKNTIFLGNFVRFGNIVLL